MQPTFDFAPSVNPSLEPVSPYASGTTPEAREATSARETRKLGQIAASLDKDNLWHRMLALYAVDDRTDAEMARLLDVERSTITGRRGELMALGKVKDTTLTRVNPKSHVPNALWGLV